MNNCSFKKLFYKKDKNYLLENDDIEDYIDNNLSKLNNKLKLIYNKQYNEKIKYESLRLRIEKYIIKNEFQKDLILLKNNYENLNQTVFYNKILFENEELNKLNNNILQFNKDYIIINNICKICMNNKITHILIPCGHFIICSKCINILKKKNIFKCPFCRINVKKINNVIFC